MGIEWTWDSEVALRGLGVLAEAALKGTVLLGVAWGVTGMLRRGSAAVRHWVWVAAMAGMVLLPVLGVMLPGWGVLPRWLGAKGEMRAEVPVVEAYPKAVPVVVRMPTVMAAQEEKASGPKLMLSGPWVVVMAWGAGVAGMLVPLGVGLLWMRRWRGKSEVMGAEWGVYLERMRILAGVGKRVELRQSGRCVVPLTYGVWRPVIVMPTEALGWGEERRRMALLHELAHIRRWDCMTQMLVKGVRALYWFHPLAWVAVARVQAECERACDDRVLTAGTKGSTYAAALMEYAVPLASGGRVPTGALAMARVSTLEGRLRAILDGGRNRRGVTWRVGLGVLVIIGAFLLGLAVMQQKGGDGVQAPGTQGAATGPKDEVVSRAELRTFSVLGAGRPGTYNIIATEMTVSQGLELAMVDMAKPEALEVTLYRRAGESVSSSHIDLGAQLAGSEQATILRNGDVISVQEKSGSAPVGGGTQAVPGVVKYVQLTNAQAAEVAQLLNAMFKPAGATTAATKPRLYADADNRTNTVVITGTEDLVKQAVDIIGRIEALGLMGGTQPSTQPGVAKIWVESVAVKNKEVKLAAEIINNRWAALEDEAFDAVFFIMRVKTGTAAEVAKALNARYGGTTTGVGGATKPVPEAYFVANPETSSVLVTCSKRNEEKIRAEVAALDGGAGTKPGVMP